MADKIPADLEYLYGGKLPYWGGLRRNLDPWARPILEILAVLVLSAALVRMVAAALGVVRRRLEIEDFDKGGFDEEYFGKYFATEVRGRLQRMAKGSRRGRINLVAGPIEAVELPSQIEGIAPSGTDTWLSPLAWVKAIPALLFWLLPRKTVKISGFLHDARERGVGATVQLARNDKVVETYTLWEKEFDKQRPPKPDDKRDGLEPLAEYVAVWLLFHMNKHLGSRELWMLGTREWKSYAFFRAGVRATEEDRPEDAKGAYVQALLHDPKLRGARFNLGRRLSQEGDDEGALKHFHRVRDEARAAAAGADRDPTLYSAEYNIAVTSYETRGAAAAKPLVIELLRQIDATLLLIAQQAPNYTDPTLRDHLLRIRPDVRVMLGGLMLETGDPAGIPIVEEEAREPDASAQTQYALACAYSIAALKPKKAADVERHAERSLQFLGRALELEPKFVELIENDRSLSWLRKHKSDAVEALVANHRDAPDEPVQEPNPLAEYTMIGDENAKRLKESAITTAAELLQRTIRPADRKALASTLHVGAPLVTVWAHAMDLARIVGMKPAHVNLLALAGVGGLDQLEAADPAHLAELLTGLGEAAGASDVPEAATVQDWVNDARTNTKPKVL